MAYDNDDIVMVGNRPLHRNVVFAQLKGLGWTKDQVGNMSEEEITQVVQNKARAPADASPVVRPPGVVNLDDVGEDPEIMGGGAAGLAAQIGEPSMVTPVGAPPPPPSAKHLRPIDPTRPGNAPGSPADAPRPRPPYVPSTEAPGEPPPVITDANKLKSILEGAAALAENDATIGTARMLIDSHGLMVAFMTLFPKASTRVLKKGESVDFGPKYLCEGGVILAVEQHPNGVHIITNTGTLTISGAAIKTKRS